MGSWITAVGTAVVGDTPDSDNPEDNVLDTRAATEAGAEVLATSGAALEAIPGWADCEPCKAACNARPNREGMQPRWHVNSSKARKSC